MCRARCSWDANTLIPYERYLLVKFLIRVSCPHASSRRIAVLRWRFQNLAWGATSLDETSRFNSSRTATMQCVQFPWLGPPS